MSTSRDRVLQALRRSAESGALPDLAPLPPPAAAPSSEDLLERFADELEKLGGRLHRPESDEAARDLVVRLCRGEGPWPVLSWAPEALPLPGLWPALLAAGLEPLEADLPRDEKRPPDGSVAGGVRPPDGSVAGGVRPPDGSVVGGVRPPDGSVAEDGAIARAARLERLAEARAGLTGVDAALAETGALLLASGRGRSRLAWLLPERHVALLPRRALRFDLAEVVEERPDLMDSGAGVALVAGPSRTADIELTLTRGVHGPRYVDVVLLP